MTQESEPLPESPQIGVDSGPAHQQAGPGDTVIYAITIENLSEEAQTQSLELRDLPPEWYTLEFDESRVAFPREQRSATLIISVPEEAQPSLHTFQVVARAGAEESAVQCSLRVLAQGSAVPSAQSEAEAAAESRGPRPPAPRVSLSPAQVTWDGEPGEEERLTLAVQNEGSQETEYSVSLEGLSAGWYVLPPKLRVPAGETLDTQLLIHPPARAKLGDYPFKVRVAVDEYPDIAAETQGRLSVSAPERVPRRRPPPPPKEKPEEAPAPETTVLRPAVSLAPRTSFRFSPGEVSAQAIITIENKSKLMERYEIQVAGIPEEWFGLAATEVRLDPGGSAQVPLRLTPRPGPGYPAGEYSFRVRVAPHRFPDSFAEVGALITLIGVPSFDARLAPAQSQGRKERFTLTLLNTGAVPLSLSMEGSDPERKCKFKFPPPPHVDPGQGAAAPIRVGARRNGLLGAAETFDFRLRVTPAEAEPTAAKSFAGRFIHQPLLGFRFAFLTLFAALVVTFVALTIAFVPPRIESAFTWIGCQIDSKSREYAAAPGEPAAPQLTKPECGGPARTSSSTGGSP
jgi:hypothetical protein